MTYEVTSPLSGEIVGWNKETGNRVRKNDETPLYVIKPDVDPNAEIGIPSPATGTLIIKVRKGWVLGATTVIAYVEEDVMLI